MIDEDSLVRAKRRFRVFHRDGFRCVYCGRSALDGICISVAFHEDHVYPESKGGMTCDENLVTACSDCNIGKGTRVLRKLPPSIARVVREHQSGYWDAPDGTVIGECVPVYAVSDCEKAAMFIFQKRFVARSVIHRQLFKSRPSEDVHQILETVQLTWPSFSKVKRETGGRPSEVWFHKMWDASDEPDQEKEFERRAREAACNEAALMLKFDRLDPQEEKELLDRLVAERRASQGHKHEVTNGR